MVERAMAWARIDFRPAHRPPDWRRLVLATVLAIVLSLLADAALVAIGKRVFPSTEHFVHFQFLDYAKLTIIGIIIAAVGWPIVTRICATPRWLYFRLAIVVTLVLFLPDLYIWVKGQRGEGVIVLMCMHVAIAVITYNLLVHLAPVREASGGTPRGAHAPGARSTQPSA
jgi:hypothetical protein